MLFLVVGIIGEIEDKKDNYLTPPHFLNEIYTASPSLRVSIKQQCFCLISFGSFLFFKNVK